MTTNMYLENQIIQHIEEETLFKTMAGIAKLVENGEEGSTSNSEMLKGLIYRLDYLQEHYELKRKTKDI